jgi:nucleotide-binding universal stress UspA family protein
MQKSLKPASRVTKKKPAASQLKLRRILVPLDFSGLSRQALGSAVPLARKYRAKISLVHVVQLPVVMEALPGGSAYLPVNTDDLLNAAKAHLAELATRLVPRELLDQTVVAEGNPAYEVISTAESLKADLIVLSTNGRSGLKRVLLGSTAERIVRHAHCPVLTVRRQPAASEKPVYPERLPWRRILVPLDFSFTSLHALKVAAALAEQSSARLTLLNVVEPSPYATGLEGAPLVIPDDVFARNAKAQLPRVAQRFVPSSVRVTQLVGHGRAASVIVETALEKEIDLIVLSTHGHTGLERLLMGSTAEHVVRHAHCPVFVVRKTRS